MEYKLTLWVNDNNGIPCFQAAYARLNDPAYAPYEVCCRKGHSSPETAAQHGGTLVANQLAIWVRLLASDTAGARALAELENDD